MAIDVEANMRIPGLTLKAPNQPTQAINNSSVRFTKIIQVPAIPKPGEPLQVSMQSGLMLDTTVTRADWSDDRGLFIVSCTYAKRSISAEEYQALISDAEWTVKQLP